MWLRTSRLGLVLAALLASGCYQAGEPDGDGGLRVDAAGPTCVPVNVTLPTLDCPVQVRLGEPVVIGIRGAHGGCCASGTLEPVLHLGPRQHWVRLDGTACDCCELCPCIGPTLETEIVLEGLEPGTHTLFAQGAICSFEVLPVTCEPIEVRELRAPSVLFGGQSYGFAAWADSAGCSCTPGLRWRGDGYEASVCGCCEGCECVDPAYELSWLGPAPEERVLRVGDFERRIDDRNLTSCPPVDGARLEVVAPRDDVIRDGPALWWVRMQGQSMYADCCGALGGIETPPSAPFEHRVVLRDCTFPCRCAGPPGQLDAWFPLGAFAPGEHRVVAPGGEVVVVNVPAP